MSDADARADERRRMLDMLPRADEDARSGMIDARNIIAALVDPAANSTPTQTTENNAGVWAVVTRDIDVELIAVYPTELDALRESNGESWTKTVFLPWGTTLTEVCK